MVPFLAIVIVAPQPRWVDRTLAGYILAIDKRRGIVGIHDAARNYYLVRTNDDDGGLVTLILTRDRNLVASCAYKVPNFHPRSGNYGVMPLVERSLPSLGTGKGIMIGDHPNTVRSRLGPPTLTHRYGRLLDMVYRRRTFGDLSGEDKQTYTFKADRLIEIVFIRDRLL